MSDSIAGLNANEFITEPIVISRAHLESDVKKVALYDRLVSMLKELECVSFDSAYPEARCPKCGAWNPQTSDHEPTCTLAQLLKECHDG